MMSLLDWFQVPNSSPSILLLDGGVSTFLESTLKKKNQVFRHRSLWSSSLLLTQEGRDDILACHEEFLSAGADILSTVTYQCHFHVYDEGMKMHAIQEVDEATMTEMLREGVRLARMATQRRNSQHPTWVVASSGCYGAALADGSEYTGNYGLTEKELMEFHRRKAQILVNQKPHALAFETIPCSLELRAIVKLLQENATSESWRHIAVWISFACQNESQLNDGSSLEEALDLLHSMDPEASLVHAVGINCCNVQYVAPLIQRLVRHMAEEGTRRGILMYPNSGEEWDAANQQWLQETGCTAPNEFAERMAEAVEVVRNTWNEKQNVNGVAPPKIIVGGCCRTSPSTIKAIRKQLDTIM